MTSTGDRELDHWIRGVLAGEIVVSHYVRLVVQQFRRDLRSGRKRGLWFDAERAQKVIRFCELQKHSTGEFAGRNFLLEPWQKFIFASLFGWKRADGTRRYREAWITIGRGNGKSPMAALILLVLLAFDDPPEARAEIKCAATERAQAYIVWSELKRMIEAQPSIRRRCEIYGGHRPSSDSNSIVWSETGSSVMPLGKESKTKDGFNLHGYVVDEEHAFTAEHKGMLEKLETAMGKRRQPLAVTITTAGDDQSHLWKAHREEVVKVVEGVVEDDALFGFICEIDEGDDPFDESCWVKANPNLDVSVKRDYLRRLAVKARDNAAKLHDFLRYHLNVLVSSLKKAIQPKLWAAGNAELPDLDGRSCHAGLDLGWRNDLASVSMMFPLGGDAEGKERYALTGRSWIPSECERDLSRPPWCNWIDRGLLQVTDGHTTDWRAIVRYLVECSQRYRLRTVALDPNNARAVGTTLVDEHGLDVFEFTQTCGKYNEPTRELLTLLEDGRLIHGGDPLLAWAASNLVLKFDSRNYCMPCKQKSSEKIDPMVAAIMALSECLFAEKSGGAGIDFL